MQADRAVQLLGEAKLLAHMRLLNQVAQATAGSHDLGRILQISLRELDRHLPRHVCAVWLMDRAAQAAQETGQEGDSGTPTLQLAAVSEAPGDLVRELGLEQESRLPLGETSFGPCMVEGRAVYADLTRPAECDSPLARDLAARGAISHVAVPLRSGDRPVGILHSVCTRPSGITAEQIQLLYLVADLLGPAVSSCQLFSRLRTAYEELRLTQNQLVQAEKMRALGELAGGMAHEFNNALCGALGFIELTLLNESLPSTCRTYLESARTCAQDAAHTVRRVQDFARQQRNAMAFQNLDLNELVRQTVELVRHKWESLSRARGQGIELEVRTEAQHRVLGSAAELREILTNLIFNAVDAMPQGGKLRVRTRNRLNDVFLEVQDTGVGINEAARRRLFEPFFTTKGERGNGLGLSVSFGIVRRHGGEITVDSQVGRGSTFTVRLPAAAKPGAQDPDEVTTVAPVQSNEGLRILVIEDEESIRRFLGMALRQLGHRPRLTADGAEGLAAFAEEHFDVVLTDLGLPEVSGEEVARRVAGTVPIVLLTGWADQLRAEVGTIEGVSYLLSKPVTMANLAASLTAVTAQAAAS
jgi:signal transduction histidine kinase